jgi:hypothetical protein
MRFKNKGCGMRERSRMSVMRLAAAGLSIPVALAGVLGAAGPASAEKVENQTATFAALDKVTGRILPLEIPINQTQQFGALRVTPRVCYTRPPTEAPHTSSFVEVDEIKLNGDVERIFTGWMFADSPGLHAVEHPVFDVWLTNCKTSAPVAPAGSEQNAAAPASPEAAPPAEAAAPAAPPPAPAPAPAPVPAPAAEAAPAPEPAPAPAPAAKKPRPRPAPPPSTFPTFGQ